MDSDQRLYQLMEIKWRRDRRDRYFPDARFLIQGLFALALAMKIGELHPNAKKLLENL